MKFFSIIFISFLFLKSFVYSLFEINETKNISGGITILVFSILAFLFCFFSICFY